MQLEFTSTSNKLIATGSSSVSPRFGQNAFYFPHNIQHRADGSVPLFPST